LRFPGQYFDAETETNYNINRDYNPVTGRYIQSDPIEVDGGVNGFGYVGGNPLFRIDENGKFWWQIAVFATLAYDSYSDQQKAIELANEARDITEYLYYNSKELVGIHNGPADAFRHSYWNCTMTLEVGYFDTYLYGTGHEYIDGADSPEDEKRMDLSNNMTGIKIALSGKNCYFECLDRAKNNKLYVLPKSRWR
jgi:RHS repeat-associated protein